MSLRTEKAIKKVMEEVKKKGDIQVFSKATRRTGNVSLVFADYDGQAIATFTLASIIAKRVPRRKKKY